MSLIEKIDAEIAEIKMSMSMCAGVTTQLSRVYQSQKQFLECLKEDILSEQKEQLKNCSNCGNNIEYPKPHTCDICTSLDQETEFEMWEPKPLTIGDKIRESNESLSAFIRGQFGDDRVFHGGNQIDLDDFLNQPSTK